jgi:hypothetical protein
LPTLPRNTRRLVASIAACLALAGQSAPARAGDALAFWGGRIRLGGDASGTIGPEDQGYFNHGNYGVSSLRLLRLDLAAELRVSSAAALLAAVRSDNLAAPRVYALYLRVRPWSSRELDLQAGLIPPVFGAFPHRHYSADDPLPSVPLAYQYLTSLRYDAVPANADQLLAQRGRGWQVRYPVGSREAGPGVPLVNGERWDVGLEVRLGREPLSLAVAVTQGTLSHPELRDENSGKQVSARFAWKPSAALTLGLSGATGDFLSHEVTDGLPPSAGDSFRQKAIGVDIELARGHWILRAEGLWNRWQLPKLDAALADTPLDALGVYAEGRYKLRPGLYLAGRVERLEFGLLEGAGGPQSWDAPVTRCELGGGLSLRRDVLLKASWQHNWRDGGRVRQNDLVAAQLSVWF